MNTILLGHPDWALAAVLVGFMLGFWLEEASRQRLHRRVTRTRKGEAGPS